MSEKPTAGETLELLSFTQEVEAALVVSETVEGLQETNDPLVRGDMEKGPEMLLGASEELDITGFAQTMSGGNRAQQTATWVKQVSEVRPDGGSENADAETLLATDVEARWTEYDMPTAVDGHGDATALTAEEEEGTTSAHDGSKRQKRTAKRPRTTPEEKREKEEASKMYRHSQHRLRREAKNFNLKEIFSKSMLSPLDDTSRSSPHFPLHEKLFSFPDGNSRGQSSFASPTGVVTPASPTTPWSPTMVGDITSHFLTAVRHKQQQTFQKIISKEMGKSQGAGPSGNGAYASLAKPDDTASSPVLREEEELVIGEVETAEASSSAQDPFGGCLSADGLEKDGELPSTASLLEFTDSQRLPSYVGKASGAKSGPAETTTKRAAEKEEEEALVRTLTRKHEMWKLQQRKVKSDRMVQQDSQLSVTRQENGKGPSTAEAAPRKSDAPPTLLDVTLRQRQTNTKSIKGTNISMDDISMIRRINSFDNTSSQRVVVFGAVQPRDQSNSKSATI